MQDSAQALLFWYRKNPCRFLPNAYWKTAAVFEDLCVATSVSKSNDIDQLAAWHEKRLMAFWCAADCAPQLAGSRLENLNFALVHDNAAAFFDHLNLQRRAAYFRLVHKNAMPVYNCPPDFEYQRVDPVKDVEDVTRFIRDCYKDMHVTPEIVRGWQAHPVYDPALWLWVIEKKSRRRAALGIAEFDPVVPEASLEWIQVLPSFRRKGLGKAVVNELVRRVSDQAAFTTVAGLVDNQTRPDLLYRSCGFSGDDVWWLFGSGE